jgi:hypothetical protein
MSCYQKVQPSATTTNYNNNLSTGAIIFNTTIKENTAVTKNNTDNKTFTFVNTGYYMVSAQMSIGPQSTQTTGTFFSLTLAQASGSVTDLSPLTGEYYVPGYVAGFANVGFRYTHNAILKVATASSTGTFTITPSANSTSAILESTYSSSPFHSISFIYLGSSL